MVRTSVLYAILFLLLVAYLWVRRRRASRKLRARQLERMRSTPSSDTLMSTILRSTQPDGTREAMQRNGARGGGQFVDTHEMLHDDWVRVPNSITGVRQDAD